MLGNVYEGSSVLLFDKDDSKLVYGHLGKLTFMLLGKDKLHEHGKEEDVYLVMVLKTQRIFYIKPCDFDRAERII